MATISSERKPGQPPDDMKPAQRQAAQRPEVDYAKNKEMLAGLFWRHPEVIGEEPAYVVVPCEGESDAEFLTEASRAGLYGVPTGLLGTTTWSSSTWDEGHTKVAQLLKEQGRLGPFIGDNNATGLKYSKMRQAAIPGHPVLMAPTEGHDLRDHFENGGTWDSLVEHDSTEVADMQDKSAEVEKVRSKMIVLHKRIRGVIEDKFPDYFQGAEDAGPGQYEGLCWLCEKPRTLRYSVQPHDKFPGAAKAVFWCHHCQAEIEEILAPLGLAAKELSILPSAGWKATPTAGSELGLIGDVDVVPAVFSDSENGRILSEILAGKAVYIADEKRFYAWTGNGWDYDYSGIVSRAARDMARQQFNLGKAICMKAVGDSDDAKRDREYGKLLMSHGASGESVAGRNRTLEAFRNHEGVTLSSRRTAFDQNPRLLACLDTAVILNGTGYETRPLRPEDYTSMNTGVAFVKGTTHEVWDAMQAKFWPDKTVREWKQMAYGYSLLGGNPERLFFNLVGDTTGGKTTEQEGVAAALGSYAASYGQSIFHGNARDRARPDLIRLMKRRYIFSSEAGEEWELHGDRVKKMVGEDKDSMREMYAGSSDFIEASPEYTPWLSTNNAPKIKNMDSAAIRRIAAIPCDVSLSRDEEDPTIRSRVRTEKAILEAILWRLVEGWCMYVDNGLDDRPDPILTATRKFLMDAAETGDFFTEEIAIDRNEEIPLDVVYERYSNEWCMENRIKDRDIKTHRAFSMQMAALWKDVPGVQKVVKKEKGKKVVMYKGLTLAKKAKEAN
jgi:P4 family phage/plasmid primase-like protien